MRRYLRNTPNTTKSWISAFILAAALAVGIASCGDSNNPNPSDSGNNTNPANKPSPSPSPSVSPEPSASPTETGTPTPSPSPTVTPTPTTSPTTTAPTFTQVNNRVIQPSCVSCHSNYSTYAGVRAQVTPGDPNGSLFFQVIQSGGMPPGTPLNAADQNLVRDWIAAGAPNN